jgi:hypothetical protein
MTATLTNGRPERRQLSDQLDRLDSILDGLSAALNEAVADAAKEGVKEAVTAAVVELLTNGDLKAALHKASAPEAEAIPERPTFVQRLKAKVAQALSAAKVTVGAAASFVADRARAVVAAAARLLTRVREFRTVRAAAALALSAATLVVAVKGGSLRRLGEFTLTAKAFAMAALDRVGWWANCALYRLGAI